jgi:hypothetical protein
MPVLSLVIPLYRSSGSVAAAGAALAGALRSALAFTATSRAT